MPESDKQTLLTHLEGSDVTATSLLLYDKKSANTFPGIHVTNTKFGDILFNDLLTQLPFNLGEMHGKRNCLYYSKIKYSYGNITHAPSELPSPPVLLKIKSLLADYLPTFKYNSILIQHYQADGKLSVHGDTEDTICENSWIMSISFGNPRFMAFSNKSYEIIGKCLMNHGDMIIISKSSQKTFLHGIMQSHLNHTGTRISLTLRLLKK